MKVILLLDVAKLGRKFEEKEVADGFARNVLIPQKKAIASAGISPQKLAEMKEYKSKQVAKKHEDILKALSAIPEGMVTIITKASDTGHLFASVTVETLSQEIKKQFKVNLPATVFDLPRGLKEVGEHQVGIVGEKDLPPLLVIIKTK